MRRSQLVIFAIKLKKELEQTGNISCGIYDLVKDMCDDPELNQFSRNRDVIKRIKSVGYEPPVERLEELVEMFHVYRKKGDYMILV